MSDGVTQSVNATPEKTRAAKWPRVGTKVADNALVEARREQILQAALRLFAEKGLAATNISAICKEAGVPVGTLYLYIRRKEDLLLLLARWMMESMEESVNALDIEGEPADKQLAILIRCVYQDMQRFHQLLKVLHWDTHRLRPPAKRAILEAEMRIVTHIAAAIERGINDGIFRPVPIAATAHTILALGQTWALKHWALVGEYGMTLDEYIKMQTEVFLRSLPRDGQSADGVRPRETQKGKRDR